MVDQNTSNQDIEDADDGTNRRTHSRRSLLASVGAGAAGLALGGLTETASASGEGSPAGEFIGDTSPATTATADGNWSDGGIWSNGVPTAGQTVRIDSGVTITVDTTTEKIKNLDVAGTLEFARDTDSHLRVETIVTRPDSTMQIGTESNPIPQGSEARITIVHHEDISEKDNDPNRISKGIITMGELTVHGAEKTTWDELATAPESGDTTIELAEAPTNWNEGDEIVIPGLDPSENEDDERTIASISGATVELDEPLEYDHVPPENNLDVELTAYALNCTRNVRFESEIKATDVTNEARVNRQGHLMIMKPAQSISYLEVDHFGRTNKRFWRTDQDYSGNKIRGRGTDDPSEPNIEARYGLHFHKTGIGEDPHEVTGVVVQHSPGWGVVNHSSHANVRDSITYWADGAGFVAEAGKERGSFERCFALRSEGARNTGRRYNDRFVPDTRLNGEELPIPTNEVDFGHRGEGFWLQGPAVAVDDCVAAGHDNYAIVLWAEPLDGNVPGGLPKEDGLVDHDREVDPQYLPLKSFSNNTVFASAGGFDYGFSLPHGESVVETFTVYNIRPTFNNSYRHYPAESNYLLGSYGNCCIASRYSRNLKVVNPQFCNVDGESGSGHDPDGYHGHGIRRNYRDKHPVGVYGGVMEGLYVGVQVGINADGEDVEGVRFHDNHIDIDHQIGTTVDGSSVANLDIYPGTNIHWFLDPDVPAKPVDSEFESGDSTHEFTVPGEYKYYWEREDASGTITVSEDPTEAEFPLPKFDNQSGALPGDSITFDASPSTPADSITSYEWDFGDGTTGSGKTVEHSFGGETGEYTVELTVTNEDGFSQTTRETVTIQEPRHADGPEDVTEGISYEYFEQGDFDGLPNFDDLEPVRTGTTGTVGLDPDHREENFAFRFTGYIDVPETGWYSFTADSDDHSELYIGSEQVIDNGSDYRDRKRSGGIALSEGLHEITLRYYQGPGAKALNVRWSGPNIETEQIPSDVLYHTDEQNEFQPRPADDPEDVTPGISYEYFEQGDFDGLPNFDDLEPVRTGTTGTVGLDPDHREENIAFRFTGYIDVPETGRYSFTTDADDASKLYIGSELVVDNGGGYGPRKRSGGIVLSEGLHEITLTYYQAHGPKTLNVRWSGPDTETEQMLGGVLYHTDGENEFQPRPADDPEDVTEEISYEYFEQGDFAGLPKFDDLEPVRRGTTETFGLNPDHREENFAFRFTGYIDVPVTGWYSFTSDSDDHSELYIGSEQVVDNGAADRSGKRSGSIALSEGLHEITLTYYQGPGAKALNVRWSGPDTETEQIPGDVLYHTDGQNEPTVTVAPDGNHEFSPADLEIEPGTTVTFEWDAGGHTVTVDSQPDDANWGGVDSTQSEGHEHSHTFDVAGTYEYYCQPHQSQMQGTITVDGAESISEAIDEDADGEIDDDEMLDAVDYWQDDEIVPGTDQTISDTEILDLVDSWTEEGSE